MGVQFLGCRGGELGRRKWSQWSGLNRRPTVYETVALPLSYTGLDSRGINVSGRRFQARQNRREMDIGAERRLFCGGSEICCEFEHGDDSFFQFRGGERESLIERQGVSDVELSGDGTA